MESFHERKKARKEYFERFVKGWKLVTCGACAGSGYYDNCIRGRVPKCACCEGTGKERVSPKEYEEYHRAREAELKQRTSRRIP